MNKDSILRKNFIRDTLLILFISAFVYIGTYPILISPVLADDLLILTTGLANLSSEKSATSLLVEYVSISTSANHILPFGGILTLLQVFVVDLIRNESISAFESWAIIRTFWQVTSLFAFALFINNFFELNKKTWKPPFSVIYAFIALLFTSVTQIHGAWIHDPVVSYGLAGFGTATFGFIYLTLILSVLANPKVTKTKAVGATLVGIIGIFNYEMFFAVFGGGLLLAYFYWRTSAKSNFKSIFFRVFLPLFFPFTLFIVSQFWRLTQSSSNLYDGTQAGTLGYVFPNFITGFYGSLPLAYIDLATKRVGILEIDFQNVWHFLLSFLVILFLLVRSFRSKNYNSFEISNPKLFIYILLLIWSVSVLIFVGTSKYQLDLNVEIGRVYLFYAFGNLCFIGVLTLVFLNGSKILKIFLLIIFLIVGMYTATYNSALSKVLLSDPVINIYSDMYSTLQNETKTHDRCEIKTELQNSVLPPYYKNELISSFEILYYHENGANFCNKNDLVSLGFYFEDEFRNIIK